MPAIRCFTTCYRKNQVVCKPLMQRFSYCGLFLPATMRIAVNTRFLIEGKMEGYGYFIEEIFLRLAQQHPEHQFCFLFDRAVPDQRVFPSNVMCKQIIPPARHPFLWYAWYNISVPFVLKQIKADVFVSPDGFCSLTTSVPQCLVVHDLAFLHYPEFIPRSHLWFYRFFTPRFLEKAKQVVTVSGFSKQDIETHFPVCTGKTAVVYNAPNAAFQPLSPDEKEQVKATYTGGVEYFFYAGAIHPRKNLLALLKAFSAFKKRQKSSMKLVITGRLAWKNEAFEALLNTYKYRKDVVVTGYVSRSELVRLTASAYAMVYPSLFEGFGVPPLESLRSGVPAIVARTSALPEIGGNAYLYFDPATPDDLADKMMLLYKDETLRSRLVANGYERLQLFSWEASARHMWDCILKTAAPE